MSQSNESNNVFEILSLMAGFRFKNLNEFKIFDKPLIAELTKNWLFVIKSYYHISARRDTGMLYVL